MTRVVGDTLWRGTCAALATMHGKGPLIAPVLHERLGLRVRVARVDTDTLGTFSGETPRPAGPVDTAIRKARMGMDAAGLPVGLASEGTIADPTGLGLTTVDTEIVVLVDDERGITVYGRATGYATIAVAATAAPGDPLDRVLQQAAVPPHHLVVSPAPSAAAGPGPTGPGPMGTPSAGWLAGTTKAVGSAAELQAAVAMAAAHSPCGRAHITTDLRAHLCPSRQPVIAAAAADLATRLATTCPACGSPGWGVAPVEVGLSCAWCAGPTDEVAGHRWACVACDAQQVVPVDTPGDPGRCGYCNP